MNNDVGVIAGIGLDQKTRKSRWPARLDLVQSASGLFLGLFMWGHMLFVSTILISKDAMWRITKMFEGYFVFGRAYPAIVSCVVGLVSVMFVLHAALAMRKFPANYRQYRNFRGHLRMLRHEDTTLWWVQVVTGFALFFLASVHLYQMLVHPGISARTNPPIACGAGAGGRSIWCCCSPSSCTAASGLYRLAVKWGWFEGDDPNRDARAPEARSSGRSRSFFLALGPRHARRRT